MSVKRCDKLKKLASVIPQIKKLEKDSTAHHEDEDEAWLTTSLPCSEILICVCWRISASKSIFKLGAAAAGCKIPAATGCKIPV
ncbi:hypothetical protein L3X38_037416 [Prunus dulcis]|uniref:Uncharacterized protein n=1 Tax=Prunus dulcis TaxID=3755 RepID=A0AAD4YQN3_PRUDU|nr:hypothetical protein L3X38_037416 [Prunus dulcis]